MKMFSSCLHRRACFRHLDKVQTERGNCIHISEAFYILNVSYVVLFFLPLI